MSLYQTVMAECDECGWDEKLPDGLMGYWVVEDDGLVFCGQLCRYDHYEEYPMGLLSAPREFVDLTDYIPGLVEKEFARLLEQQRGIRDPFEGDYTFGNVIHIPDLTNPEVRTIT